jgi:DMSO/TMAO reductase YedYZ molybdopterin-dependent catalytic subunit
MYWRRLPPLSAILLLFGFATAIAAEPNPAASAADPGVKQPVVEFAGRVKRPTRFDLERLRSLPAENVQVAFDTERGPQKSSFTGVRLWALLDQAGGIDDPGKGAEFHHIVRITGRDGYMVVISTGEIAPEFGGKPALLAYRRDGAAQGETGFRLVMPGDKRGGRYVRDVVSITVE